MKQEEFNFFSREQEHIDLFKHSMQNKELMHNMVRKSVPESIYSELDTRTLRPVDHDFYDACHIKKNADILYEVKGWNNNQYYIYFLWDDRELPGQRFALHFLSVSFRVMEQSVEKTKKVKWPLVIPVLIATTDFRAHLSVSSMSPWVGYAQAGEYGPT